MKKMKRIIALVLVAAAAISMSITVFGAEGSWNSDGSGWWYQNSDGTYPSNSWQFIDGSWYYFNDMGYMETGWICIEGIWYYLEESGEMHIGWYYDGTSWYYLNGDGKLLTGPQVIDGVLYFFNDSGAWEYDYISEEPNYDVYLSIEEKESKSEVEMVLENYGTKTLRVYAEDAYLTNGDNKTHVDMVRMFTDGKPGLFSYFDIPSGTAQSILFVAYDDAPYNDYSTLSYNFYYDRLYYTGFSSNYYGTSFYEKSY